MELDFSNQILASKRAGPKSAAQTPAKPEDRIKGSPKNPPGSAGTSPQAKEKAQKNLDRKDEKKIVKAAITFSDKVTNSLKKKVENHNKKHSRKVSLSQLKKVYRRGAGAFSSSSRPGMNRNAWAMARVNTFLRMMGGGKVKDSYRAADQDISKASEENIKLMSCKSLDSIDFENYELAMAASDLAESDISLMEMCGSYESEEDEEYNEMSEAEKKTLNKPFRLPSGSNKKFGVYVKNEKSNVVMVKFGDPNMEIKRDDPLRRKSFRARHQCDTNPGPKYKARYWSCRMWEGGKSVTEVTKGSVDEEVYDQLELLKINSALMSVTSESDENEEKMDMVEQTFSDMSYKSKELMEAILKDPKMALNFSSSFAAPKLAVMDEYMSAVYDYGMLPKTEKDEDLK